MSDAELGPPAPRQAKTDGRPCTREIEWGGYIMEAYYPSGTHPLFRTLATPPTGYRFTTHPRLPSPNQARILDRIILSLDPQVSPLHSGIPFYDRAIREMHHIVSVAVRGGARLEDAREFFAHRHPDYLLWNTRTSREAELLLMPTVPFVIGAVPWLIEIEDNITLFHPYFVNGESAGVDVEGLPCYRVLRALLEADSCQGIITHSSSTAKSLPRLFQSPGLAGKIHHVPYGATPPDIYKKKPVGESGEVRLLFTSSWDQSSSGFNRRGGLDTLEAFAVLAERFPQVTLTLRCRLPELNDRHTELVRTHPRIHVLDDFMTDWELHELMLESDIYVLPAARLHVVSVVNALGYGLPVVVADGWGMAEYVREGIDGFIVPGRWGVVSWEDPANGLLREDYSSIIHPNGANAQVVEGLIDRLSKLISDVELRQRMGANARAVAESRYSLTQWNAGLKAVLDGLPQPPPPKPRPARIERGGYNPDDPATEEGVLFRALVAWLLTFHRGKRIVCYGTGADLLAMLEHGVFHEHQIVGLLDDRRKPGSSLEGYRVVRPRDLVELKPELIVITTSRFAGVLRERAIGIVAALELDVPII